MYSAARRRMGKQAGGFMVVSQRAGKGYYLWTILAIAVFSLVLNATGILRHRKIK